MIAQPFTEASVLAHIRELTFDRFVTPTFFVRTKTGETTNYTMTIDGDGFHFTRLSESVDFLYSTYTVLGDLLNAIIQSSVKVEVVYSGNFIDSEPSTTIMNNSGQELDKFYPIFRQNYFSQDYVEDYFAEYCQRIIGIADAQLVDVSWDDQFAPMSNAKMEHFCLWVAFQLVGKRRLYELANSSIQQSSIGGNPLSDGYGGTDYLSSGAFSLVDPGTDITLSIADVFTMGEKDTALDNGDYSRDIPKDMVAPWLTGSDNILMDYYSFFYRLQLWIRQRFENLFGDTSLRQDMILVGKISLQKDEYMYSYFDSYPWVFSPYPRGIRTSPYGNLNNNP